MAMEDFYAVHRDYTTKLVLHIRDSNGDNIRAASEGTYQNCEPLLSFPLSEALKNKKLLLN
jgi:hypothetical protein